MYYSTLSLFSLERVLQNLRSPKYVLHKIWFVNCPLRNHAKNKCVDKCLKTTVYLCQSVTICMFSYRFINICITTLPIKIINDILNTIHFKGYISIRLINLSMTLIVHLKIKSKIYLRNYIQSPSVKITVDGVDYSNLSPFWLYRCTFIRIQK